MQREWDEITDVFEQKVGSLVLQNDTWKSHTDGVWHGRVNSLFTSVSRTDFHLAVSLAFNSTLRLTLSGQFAQRSVHMTVFIVISPPWLGGVIVVWWRHEVEIAWRQREVEDVEVDGLARLNDDHPRTVFTAVTGVSDRPTGQMTFSLTDYAHVWVTRTWAVR